MSLPEKFAVRMKELLKDEYNDYLRSFDEERSYGLRANTLKIPPEKLNQILKLHVEPISWCEEGFYYKEEDQPTKHPYYYAGLYYIQEPSAMAPGAILDVQPGDKVLDLCAAPGGKSTQVGAKLNHQGVLISNDISPSRAKSLLKNIELFGITNAVITSETPDRLSERFENYFDKILVDAPCSGEGMFRKDPGVMKNWEAYDSDHCCTLQREILIEAAKMLKPGGQLLYSTCTFAPEENEGMMEEFLASHPDFRIVPIPKKNAFVSGKPEWVNGSLDLAGCVRLWPHKIKGEGHFIALLQKKENDRISEDFPNKSINERQIEEYRKFEKEVFNITFDGNMQLMGEKLYLLPDGLPNLKGLRILRSGWYLGDIKKNRFEPSQAFAMGLEMSMVKNVVNFSGEDSQVIRYLKGESFECTGKEGWNLVCVDGYPLGWGKIQNKRLKNKYFPGWRWM